MRAPLPALLGKSLPLLFALLGLLLAGSQALDRLDYWLYDTAIRAKQSREHASDIIIVAVDEKSLGQLGRWPWPRELHAQLLDKLQMAKAVGMDIVLAEPSLSQPEADDALTDAIRRNGRVVGPVFPELQDGRLVETRPIPPFARAMRALGHTDYELDSDGVIRRVYLQAGLGSLRYDSFAKAVEAVANHKPLHAPPPLLPPNAAHLLWQRDQIAMVPFAGGPRPYQVMSYIDALNLAPPQAFAGKIVLIGATATGLGDAHSTPISANDRGLPGVEINAFMVHGIAHERLVRPLPFAWKIAINGLLILLLDLMLSRLCSARNLLPVYALAGAGALLASGVAMLWGQLWVGSSVTAVTLLLAGCARYVGGQSRLFTLATTDGLTGLTNRRYFDEVFSAALQAHREHNRPLALLILDLDNFKGYNDHYGHFAGDLILKRLAKELQASFPDKEHLPARLGGEEFGVLLQGQDLPCAIAQAEAFRRKLAALELPHQGNAHKIVTCSIGVAARVPEISDGTRTLFEDADHALYIAKRSGRNQVSPSPQPL